jgi:hypothetical protein
MHIPLDEVFFPEITTSNPSTGGVSDADSTPTYEVFEEDTDTPILAAQSFTKRTSKTGDYRGSVTCSAANGFEVGKWYSVVASATVNAVAGKLVERRFRIVPAEGVNGQPKVDVGAFGGAAGTFSSGRPEIVITATGLAGVKTQMTDALNVDTYAEPGQEAPPATASIVRRLGWLYKLARNKKTQTATTLSIYADDASTVDAKASVSDDGSVFTQNEIATGP